MAGHLRSLSESATTRHADRLRRRAGHHAARATGQARGVGRALGPADRVAPATELPVVAGVVAARMRRGRPAVRRPSHSASGSNRAVVSLAVPHKHCVSSLPGARGVSVFVSAHRIDTPARQLAKGAAVRRIQLLFARNHE